MLRWRDTFLRRSLRWKRRLKSTWLNFYVNRIEIYSRAWMNAHKNRSTLPSFKTLSIVSCIKLESRTNKDCFYFINTCPILSNPTFTAFSFVSCEFYRKSIQESYSHQTGGCWDIGIFSQTAKKVTRFSPWVFFPTIHGFLFSSISVFVQL